MNEVHILGRLPDAPSRRTDVRGITYYMKGEKQMANLYGVSAYQQTNSTWNNTRTNNTKTRPEECGENRCTENRDRQREDNDLQPSRYDRFARADNEERIWDGNRKCGAV